MTFRFHPDARDELAAAAAYYDDVEPGLAARFLDEVQAAVARILDHPDAWSPSVGPTRRCLLNRFPFGIVYRADGDGVLLVAVTHLHRKPGYWRDRLKSA